MPESPNQYGGFWVTVYTDASFKPETKWAAWAAWLKCSKGRHKEAFICPPEIRSSFQAEYYSIFMGIRLAVEKFEPEGVLVVNDCEQAIRSVWPWNTPSDQIKIWRKQIDEFRNKGLEIRTKMVKGHQGGRTIQSWLNEWCDRASKNAREKVEQHTGENESVYPL